MPNMPLDRRQVETCLELTEGESDTAHRMPEIGEGEKLRQLLEANRYKKKDLADAIHVTKQAVDQWMKAKEFTPRVWERVRLGLTAMRLNPAHIRPVRNVPAPPTEDLTRLVENYTRVQLSVLKRILDADDDSRRVLLAYVNGALREIP